MAKEKKPIGRPKGSGKGRRGKAVPQGDNPRTKTKACPALSKAGHGTDWHCDQCNDSGEVSA